MVKFIEIWEPRYRDRVILVAPRHLPASGPAYIEITKSTFKGRYKVEEEDWKASKAEILNCKNGAHFSVKAIPLDKLVPLTEGGDV